MGLSSEEQQVSCELFQRTVGVCDYVDELRVAGFSAQQFAECLHRFDEALSLLARQRAADAQSILERQSREQPRSAVLAVTLAASQTVGRRFLDAEKSLTRAVRLKPDDAGLAELQRRATALSRRGDTPAETSPAVIPLKEGDVLDGWAWQKLLGRGGWGQVYLAEKAGKAAALKVLHPELSRDHGEVPGAAVEAEVGDLREPLQARNLGPHAPRSAPAPGPISRLAVRKRSQEKRLVPP